MTTGGKSAQPAYGARPSPEQQHAMTGQEFDERIKEILTLEHTEDWLN